MGSKGKRNSIYTYTFKVDPKMFRKALYFNTFGKSRVQAVLVVIMFVLGLGVLISSFFLGWDATNVTQICGVVLFAAFPLLIFSCEQGYRRYRDSDQAGLVRKLSVSDEWMKFTVIGASDSEKVEWRLVSNVFELEDFFLIFRDADLMVVLPKSVVSLEEQAELRSLFRRNLGRGFHLRCASVVAAEG